MNPAYRHGANRRGARTTEYEIWVGIRKRVHNANDKLYPYYGGRGVTLCEEWEDFSVFLRDVGRRPSKAHSLDRKDNDGPYAPGNVRWATKAEQARNRRSNVLVEGKTLKEQCAQHGFAYKTVWRWYVKEKLSWSACLSRGRARWNENGGAHG
jgi:hypothetical protein